MTAVDDLKVGMYVAIVNAEYHKPAGMGLFGYSEGGTVSYTGDGTPLKVLAISLPFICVEANGKRQALDVRTTRVARLSASYVKAMQSPPKPTVDNCCTQDHMTFISVSGGSCE